MVSLDFRYDLFDCHMSYATANPNEMIAQLRGRLLDKRPDRVLVDVGGVGYLVHIPLSTYSALGELHDEVSMLIHTHMRDASLSLYGFGSARERYCFELLIAATGVGPFLAMKILSGMSVSDLIPAIRNADVGALTQVPGVGKKTAERIVLETRDKLSALKPAEPPQGVCPGETSEDVISALINLGYERRTAESVMADVYQKAGSTFESMLRAALRELAVPAGRDDGSSK